MESCPVAASVLRMLLLMLLLMSPFVVGQSGWSGPSSADQQVLQLVNTYRVQDVGISALVANNAAACVGYEVAQRYVGQPCNNATGADAEYGQTPNFSDFPSMLAACGVALVNATGGQILTDCVPSDSPTSDDYSIAAQNFTRAPRFQVRVNDTTYTSGGVGSAGVWYVLVLATDSAEGSFGVTPGLDVSAHQQLQFTVMVNVLLLALAVLFLFER